MYNGKKKALTFSYDDGVTQDLKLIEILDKYGLKCTFNVNSALLGRSGALTTGGKNVTHNKINTADVRAVYSNHETAVHTLTHPSLANCDDAEITRQVEEDRVALSKLVGYDVVGMAYPNGSNDDRVAGVIRDSTGVKYSRTVSSTGNFDPQDNLYRFNPTVYHCDMEKMFKLGEEFIKLQTETPKLFYIWGHSYELDVDDRWQRFEEFCKLISGKDDIYYCTNKDALL
jgi:peptidoglycan/xylan/chitin deacetylase (PgdA/CDA1 family)